MVAQKSFGCTNQLTIVAITNLTCSLDKYLHDSGVWSLSQLYKRNCAEATKI